MKNENKKGRKKKEIGYDYVFAKRLRGLMEENKTTQPQLAEAVGVSRQAVGQWQNGNTVPDILDFQKIADFYNVPADYLLGRSESQSNDKDLKDVADYLGISDTSVSIIRRASYKSYESNAKEFIKYNNGELKNGFRSNSSDICNWIIWHLFFQIRYVIGALLVQMYRLDTTNATVKRDNNKESLIDYKANFDYSDFAHIQINKIADICKKEIDDLLLTCAKKSNNIKYRSLYSTDLLDDAKIYSIEDYKKISSMLDEEKIEAGD